MKTINVYQAKSQLSRLIDEAMAGEEIVIAKNGKPFVTLTPYAPKNKLKMGLWADTKFEFDDEHFDDEDPELIKLFEEGRIFPNE